MMWCSEQRRKERIARSGIQFHLIGKGNFTEGTAAWGEDLHGHSLSNVKDQEKETSCGDAQNKGQHVIKFTFIAERRSRNGIVCQKCTLGGNFTGDMTVWKDAKGL